MQVKKTDIVGIVHKANRNRGWISTNYNLLDDPELNNTQEKEAVINANGYFDLAGVLPFENTDCLSLNGASRSLLSKIVGKGRKMKPKQIIRQNKVREFEEAKKLTAGAVFNGHGCHLDESALQKIREINESRERREQERLDNQCTKNDRIFAKVAAIQVKQMTYEQ